MQADARILCENVQILAALLRYVLHGRCANYTKSPIKCFPLSLTQSRSLTHVARGHASVYTYQCLRCHRVPRAAAVVGSNVVNGAKETS
jgi:hypothetical protein